MKSISLLPVYQHKANTYAALSNPLYDEDVATYSKENGQENYYHYLLTVGKNKNLDKSIFQGLEDAEDKLTKLYGATLADNKERKEWDLQITDPTDTSKTKNFVGTEVQYLDKIIELKREYKKWEQDRAMEQAEKDAMNGWQKAGTGFISFMGNLAVGFEQFLAGTAEFLAGGATWLYHGVTGQGFDKENYKDIGLTEAVDKQAEGLADFERRYTDFRDVYGNLTTGGKVATTIAQAIGQQLPAAIANIFLPGSGNAALYIGSAAGSLNQYITESEVPVWEAAIKVGISTGFEWGIERGLGKLWGRTGADIAKYGNAAENATIRDLAKSLTGKEGAKILGKTVLRGVKDIAQESLEEFLQEWSNVVIDFVSSKINTGFQSDIEDLLTGKGGLDIGKAFERTLYAGLAGAAGAGFFGGIGKIRREASVSKGLKQITGYDSNLFNKEYVIDDGGKVRKLNFFEKIALQTNIRGIFERIQLAQNGALSQEARTEIWENTLMLGDFFNSLSKEDLDASLKLFNEIHNYAEEQGKKLRNIEEFKKGSLIAKVPNNAKSEFFTKDDSVEISEKEKDKFYSGEVDLTFGSGLLQQLYGARNTAREKGLKESRERRARRKTEKVQGLSIKEIEDTPSKTSSIATAINRNTNPATAINENTNQESQLSKAFETSQKQPKTKEELENETWKIWATRSKDEIALELTAIQNGERDYTAKEAEIVRGVLKSLFNSRTLPKRGEKKLSKKEQKERAKQEAKEKAEKEREEREAYDKAKEEAYDKGVEQYEKAPLDKLLKARESLKYPTSALEVGTEEAITDIYNEKLKKEFSDNPGKIITIQDKYKNLTQVELTKKLEELKAKTLTSKAGLSNVLEYEVVKGMLPAFKEYDSKENEEMWADHPNPMYMFNYSQRERKEEIGAKEEYTWGEVQYVLYGNDWQKLNKSLTNEETRQQLADDLVTEVNPLMEALEEIENLENLLDKKSFLTLNSEIEKGGRKAYLTNGDKIITDKSVVYIPNKVLTNPNGNFVIEQITEEDIINKCVETYLAPIEVGIDEKATKYEKDQYKLFTKMKDAFFSQFSNLKPNKGESDNHFFVRMLFTDIGPYSAIKYLLPSEYKKGIQLILTAVVGLEKELGKFGDAYQKRGHKIFETFQKAAIHWLTQNFATYYRNTEVVYANPLDFTNLLNSDQIRYIVQQRKNIPLYADGKSFVSQTKVENPQVMTLEDSKIQLKTMGVKNRFALDILGVVEGKKRYDNLAQDNPVRSFWKNPQAENAGLDMLIASNKMGNETYPRASKTIIENATEEQVRILAKTTLGYTNIVPGYLVTSSSNKEQATTNGYTIVIQNFKYDNRYYAPIVNEKGEVRYVYARDQRYEVVERDEKNKRIVIVPKEEFINEEAVGFETTEESLSLWPGNYEILDENKTWTFPRFTKTSFPFIKGKETSLADLLRSDLSQMTKERITVTDMINYPGDLLNEDFKAKIGILTKANVYQAIQNYLLDNSEGRLSLAMDRNGDSYYVGNIAPVYDFMSEEAVDWLTEDFDGYSLAEDFTKKIEEDVNYYKIKDFFPKLATRFPAIGEVKIYLNLLSYAGSAYGATTTGLEYIERDVNEDVNKKPIENETVREPKIEINFQYSDNKVLGRTSNGHLMFIVAHEVQHVLQEQFGWVWGTNPSLQVPQSVKNFILNTEAYKNQYEAYLKDFGPNGAAGDSEKAFQTVVYINNIGEIQANLDTPARNGLGFVTMIEPNGKVNVITPDGRIHYANHTDQDKVTKTVPVSSYIDAGWWESLDTKERNQFRSTTQLKRTNELYQKYYVGKNKRLDKRVQGFLEDVKNEEGLNKLPRDLAALIREDAAIYDDFIAWFKQAKDIDEHTFKLFVDNIFPGTEIKSFKELEELTLKLGYALDEEGNLQLDSRGNPKENVYRNRGQVFSPDFDKYRAALMQHYDPSLGLKGMQKYVRQAEFLGRTVAASDIKADEEDKREFGDTDQTTNTLEDQIYGKRQRLEMQVAKYVAMKEKEKYKKGEITEQQLNQKLAKLRPNRDGDIELFDRFSDSELKTMHRKLVAQETKNLGGIEAAERKITQAEADRGKKSNSQLDTEKATRRGLRKIAEVLGYMTDEEIKDLIGNDAQYFHRDENGKLVYHVTGRWSLTEDVQSARENLLNRLKGHVDEWKAKQKGRREAFHQAQIVKQKQAALEEQKKKVEVATVEPNRVAPVNQIGLKVGDKLIKFKSTTNQIPNVLEKIFNNVFDKNNLENNKEEHYSNENMREFMKSNGNLIINMNPQNWFSVLQFFEQSEVEGDGPEANAFRAARLYTLFSMVILMKTGRTVMNKDYINQANNLMEKPSMTTKETNAWNNLMLKTQGKGIVAQTHSFIPTKVQEEFETAMVTSMDSSDENFTNAVIHLKQAIVEEAEEAKKKKTKVQSIWDKVLSFRYTAMLSSPMTWFRNAFSNRVVRKMNGWVEKIGNALTKWSWVGNKIPVDKFTEKIIRFETRTEFDETLKVPIIGKKQGDYILVGTKVKKSVAQWIQDKLVKNGLLHELTQGYSKYDPDKRMKDLSGVNYIVETIVDNYRKQYNLEHTFNTEFLNKFHKFVTRMISDEKFINEATLKYFGKMLTEDIDKGRLHETELLRSDLLDSKISEIFAKAQWLAFTDYMRNGNFVTKWLSELSKGDNFFAKYAIPLVAPFAQSSVNWWVETMRYSPFGLAKAVINLVKYDKYIKKMDERRQVRGEIATPEGFDRYLLVRNLGKGVLGTVLWSIGFMLSAMGIAGLSKKGDKYIIHIGDKVELDISKYFNSSSVIAGIATLDSIKNVATGKVKDWTSIFSNVLNAYGETLFLSDLLGEYQYHDGLGGYIKDLPYNFIYSMVPNIMKLTASVTHVGKTNYDSGFVGKIQRLLAGIPGMPYLLDQWAGVEVNPYTGEKYKGWGLVENAFKQFGFGNTGMNYFGISEVEREAIKHNISLNNLTGNIKVGDKEYKFNKNNMNEKAGKYVSQLVNQLLDGELLYKDKTYGKMTSEEQKEAMKHYINKAREYAKIDVWTSNGHKYYASQEMYNTLKNLGIGNVYLGSKGYVE